MKSTVSSNIPYLPLPHHTMLRSTIEANEDKFRIQHSTGGVGALCKQPYEKCPNKFDDDRSCHFVGVIWTNILNFDIMMTLNGSSILDYGAFKLCIKSFELGSDIYTHTRYIKYVKWPKLYTGVCINGHTVQVRNTKMMLR